MKAYPLIYSRTKKAGFIPDFLVRPENFDYEKALEYVDNMLSNVDTLKSVRYCVFSVDGYCVCGISGRNKVIVNQLELTPEEYEKAMVYTADFTGRNIKSFIGFVIPKSDIKSNNFPDLKLMDYWKKYCEYISLEWDKVVVNSIIENNSFTLDTKIYSERIVNYGKIIQGKYTFTDFNSEETPEYFLNKALYEEEISFISDINYMSDFNKLVFKYASVTESLYMALSSLDSEMPNSNTDNKNFGNESNEEELKESIKATESCGNKVIQKIKEGVKQIGTYLRGKPDGK